MKTRTFNFVFNYIIADKVFELFVKMCCRFVQYCF